MTLVLGRRFRRLWGASAVSNLGDGLTSVALPLLAAELTRDPVVFSAVLVANKLPWLLFVLQAGAITDRANRKRLMAIANAIRFTLLGVLAALVIIDQQSILLLLTVAFLLGVGDTFFDTAAQALLPIIVNPEQLEAANGRLLATEVATNRFVGPPLGGFLFGLAAAIPLIGGAASYAVSALLILAIPGIYAADSGPTKPTSRRHLRREIAVGLRWLWGHRLLRVLALLLGAGNGLSSMAFAVFALFALDLLGVNGFGFGVLLAGMAFGSVLGIVATGRIIKIFGRGPSIVGSVSVLGASYVAIGLSTNPIVAGALLALGGACVSVWSIITTSLRQSIIPDRLLGRVTSAYRFIGWGAIPIGIAAGGLIAGVIGLRVPFLLAGASLIVLALLVSSVINNPAIEDARGHAERTTEG